MAVDNTYQAIATQTVTSTLTSGIITFSSIPQTYTDLVIVAIGQGYTSASYGNLQLQFNGDTGSNYSTTFINVIGSVTSNRTSNASFIYAGSFLDWGTPNQNVGHAICNVMNYSNTTTYKSTISRDALAQYRTGLWTGTWRNTAAITSLTLTANDTPINTGSMFTLYGIKAA